MDSSKAHGSPLGTDEVALTRSSYGWPDEQFRVSDDIRNYFEQSVERKKSEHQAWLAKMANWRDRNPEKAATYHAFGQRIFREPLEGVGRRRTGFGAARKTSQAVLDIVSSCPMSSAAPLIDGLQWISREGYPVMGSDEYQDKTLVLPVARCISASESTRWVRSPMG